MNNYETVIIMSNKISEDQRKNIISKITELISNNGTITKSEELGEKMLAYEIKKHKRAFYYVFYYKANPSFIDELNRNCRITEEIIKFITFKNNEEGR